MARLALYFNTQAHEDSGLSYSQCRDGLAGRGWGGKTVQGRGKNHFGGIVKSRK